MDVINYIHIHEEFIKAGLVETAVLQFTTWGNLQNFRPELIEYINSSPNWDFQIHGWQHEEYDKMKYDNIVKELSACIYWTQRLFKKTPTIWFPPWNRRNEVMEKAASFMNLTIDNESYDIAKFVREVQAGIYKGHSLYFHGWKADEMVLFYEMIECVKKVNAERKNAKI
jgi:peptidoglycan/xylan/chitin deacetylase (PgdA/CDA1 family)